ncbi:MAG: hypothetical protein PHQ98_02345 [Candidatus ainarchaeum sp.]|nr:hypothetical protein [Candidatus ainarchaeum sp.]
MGMDFAKKYDLSIKLIGIIILALIFLIVITWTGYLKCGTIPYWCDVYDVAMGPPKVLIVYGDTGLGDAEQLKEFLSSPKYVGKSNIYARHIDGLSIGTLSEYTLVIVTSAKLMSYSQIEMFIEYINKGGRLVWTGDAGTEIPIDEKAPINNFFKDSNSDFNPWIRIKEDNQSFEKLDLSKLLGLSYFANYCELKKCSTYGQVGILEKETKHILVDGVSERLDLRIGEKHDLAIVKQNYNGTNNQILTLNFGSTLNTDQGQINKKVPFLTTSGPAQKVIYYSMPLEYLMMDNNFITLFADMYSGALGR